MVKLHLLDDRKTVMWCDVSKGANESKANTAIAFAEFAFFLIDWLTSCEFS